jgi:hypothetical protein
VKTLFFLIVLASGLSAQDLRTATLLGTVTDSSGGSVANALITVINVETNVMSKSTSNAEGSYYIPFLIPGNYRLQVEAAGFKQFERTDSR